MNLYQDLQARGLINQVTDEEIQKRLESPLSLYCGFDPTADSLHIGHLLPLCMLKRFLNAGHKPIALIGGATGLIGDPSFKKDERSLNSKEVVTGYVEAITKQIKDIIGEEGLLIENNYNWVKDINMIDFLRDYGKHFTINYMISKDCVSSRIESGISFTEFSYMLLQAMDFYQLYNKYETILQVGGSDQWGNITTGLELIRRQGIDTKCYGLTVPLVTKSDGTKFGKTEGGAIWLDPKKTSPYEFYQYFFNVEDKDVIKYIKYFTFLDLEEIAELEKATAKTPQLRLAQKRLASEVTSFVHGKEALEQVIETTKCLFTGDISHLSKKQIETYFTHIDQYEIEANRPLVDALIDIKLASSRREAREFIENNSIRINGNVISDTDYVISDQDLIAGMYMMIKRGKKKIHFVKVK